MYRIMYECGLCGYVSTDGRCKRHGPNVAHYPLRMVADSSALRGSK